MFERIVEDAVFKGYQEKTAYDKLLARKPIEDIRQIIKKPDMTREETLELLYLISGEELKLLNWSDHERYVDTKYFVWVQEFVKVVQIFYDFKEDFAKFRHVCIICRKLQVRYKVATDEVRAAELTPEEVKLNDYCICHDGGLFLSYDQVTDKSIRNVERYLEHDAKFLAMVYMNLARSSLSQSGTGFIELLKNKIDISYPLPKAEGEQEKKKSWWSS